MNLPRLTRGCTALSRIDTAPKTDKTKKLKTSDFSLFSESARREWDRKIHGGAHLRGRRKTKRPLHLGKPLHLVFRASVARGDRSMLRARHEGRIRDLLERESRRHGVRVMKFVNVGNHLHLVVLPKNRRLFARFLRAFSGLVARMMLGAERGRAVGRFWDARPFSRVLEWGKDLKGVLSYFLKNELEAIGWVEFVRRKPVQAGNERGKDRRSRPPDQGRGSA